MASSGGLTALTIIGIGVGGYALYRFWKQSGGHFDFGAEHHIAHGGHAGVHDAAAARGYFDGYYGYYDYVGRGGGRMPFQHQQQQQQQQQQQADDSGGAGSGEFGMPQQQHPPFASHRQYDRFARHGRR
jgi:hypothetical protein